MRFEAIVGCLLVLLLVPLLSGCERDGFRLRPIVGSGRVVTEEKDITGFTDVEVGSAFEVEVKQGDTYRVAISADDNVMEYVEASKIGSTLRIRVGRAFPVNVRLGTLKAEITMPEIYELRLGGATRTTIAGFKSSHSFEANVSGASTLSGDIQASHTRVDVSGASTVKLKGSGTTADVEVSGASRADLSAFALETASVTVSGASTATVDVKDQLDRADVSGASTLLYLGSPRIGSTNVSGASNIRRR